MIFYRKLIILWLLIGWAPWSRAELTIEITQGIETAIPIAVVPFAWNSPSVKKTRIAKIIQADLSRSGYFKTLSSNDMLTQPKTAEQVQFRNWQALGQDYLLIGQVNQNAGRYDVQFQLFDVYKGEQLMGYRMTVSADKLRHSAHHISNLVFEKLTGKAGVFNSRIAYITSLLKANGRKQYKLQIADADGYHPITIASSNQPLMSPAWSPDGKKIAYVSFENKHSAVYVQTLSTGWRKRVSAFRGINGAPAFSPDGHYLALTLSKDGSPDIYLLNLHNKALTKLTTNYAIDTEAVWSPDGRNIVFTSDRGGKPQLYIIPRTGGRATRLTFEGNYNARARFSKDGKTIAMVHADHGDYRIAIMDMATRTLNVLTAGPLDESPSFAPNDTMILYATQSAGRGVLSAVSVDGKMHQKLEFVSGDVREPAWAP